MPRSGLPCFCSSALALLLAAILCVTMTGCKQALQPKAAAWPYHETFTSYIQRRCAPVAGPKAPGILWKKDFTKPSKMLDVLLRPQGGVVICVLEDEIQDSTDAPAPRAEHILLTALDSEGEAGWESRLEVGSKHLNHFESFSDLNQAGDTFYCCVNLNKRWTSPPETEIESNYCNSYRFDLSKREPELRKWPGEYCKPFRIGSSGELYMYSVLTGALSMKLSDLSTGKGTSPGQLPEMGDVLRMIQSDGAPGWQERRILWEDGDLPDPGQSPTTAPLVVDDDGSCYYALGQKNLARYTPEGDMKWRREPGKRITNGPLLRPDGTVMITSCEHPFPERDDFPPESPAFYTALDAYHWGPRTMTCFDTEGKVLWRHKTRGAVGDFAAVSAGGGIVFAEDVRGPADTTSAAGAELSKKTARIVSLDPEGTEVFKHELARSESSYTLGVVHLDSAGNVYWSDGASVVSLDAAGKERYQLDLPDLDPSISAPCLLIGPDGRIYVWGYHGVLCLGDK